MVRAPIAIVPALLIFIALWVLFIFVIVLLIRALLKYLRSDKGRAGSPEQAKSLGEALKARRTATGYTQEYVAEALGVSRQAVSKWENGTSDPSTANLMALSKLYGLPVDELLRPAETDE